MTANLSSAAYGRHNTIQPADSWSDLSLLLSPSFYRHYFTSRDAIPVYFMLGLFLLSRLPSLPTLLERHSQPATSSTSAFVVPAETRHARFLPTQSRHAFRYNALYLALRLDALEKRALDSRGFAWKGAALQPEFVDETALARRKTVTPTPTAGGEGEGEGWKAKMRTAERIERRRLEEKRGRNERVVWSFTGLHPREYLRTHFPGETKEKAQWLNGSMLLKLAYELRERGFMKVGPQDEGDWSGELGHVWTVTMPSIAGITGINPLTVHYCFRPHTDQDQRGKFWLVVLEVHNTFSERHIYVLEAGVNEDAIDTDKSNGRRGYDHQWTFARAFHVSPFNDRGGFYRFFLKQPFSSSDEFVLGIRLLLMVESEAASTDQPTLAKKLMATLDSSPATSKRTGRRQVRPLSNATLYAALLRQPLDLFLTFFRILWEAGKLHFSKKLDAFGRPDMVQPSENTTTRFEGVGLPPSVNAIQPHRDGKSGRGSGGLVYPAPGWAERVAKDYVKSLFERRVAELQGGWAVRVESTDPADDGLNVSSGHGRELVLYTRSYGVYVDLTTYQPRLALLLGSVVGRRWGVNDLSAFNDFFGPSTSLNLDGVRKRHLEHLLAPCNRTHALKTLSQFGITTTSANQPKTEEGDGWRVTTALWIGYLAAVAEKKAFAALGARYVKGTEPWLALKRGLEYIESNGRGAEAGWDTRLGSVVHS